MRNQCSVDDCDRLEDRRGFCNKHYRRYMKYGDAEFTPYERAPKGKTKEFVRDALSSETDDCIIWPFGKDSDGYGWFTPETGSHPVAVHRFICQKVNGDPVGERDQSAHSCGNPSCVNKNHLRWATRSENMQDKHIHLTMRTRKDRK